MLDQSAAACPESAAHRVFPMPGLGARKHQVRKVGAGDEQHEADSRLEDPNRAAYTSKDLVTHRFHLEDMAAVLSERAEDVTLDACTFAPVLNQLVQLPLGGFRSDPVLQPADHIEIVVPTILPIGA